MRFSLLPLLLVVLLLGGCATTPVVTSEWQAGPVTNYETRQAGLGWGQRYQAAQGWADAYFYDLGQTWLDMEAVAAADGPFEAAIQEIQAAAGLGVYRRFEVVSRGEQEIGGWVFQHAVLRFEVHGRRKESHLYVAPYAGRLVKLRVTLHLPASDTARASISDLVAQHLAALRRATSA